MYINHSVLMIVDFTKDYYLTPTFSIDNAWNSILNVVYHPNNTYTNNTFTNNTITTNEYIFNINIKSNLTHINGSHMIDLPYSNRVKRITINLDCLDDTCHIYIANGAYLFIVQQFIYFGTDSLTHITFTISSFVYKKALKTIEIAPF